MLNIMETEFTEFEQENTGNVHKYISPREINDFTHNRNNNLNKIFIMKDWEKRSNDYISTHIYDRAKSDFITLGNLEIEMNNIE